MTRNRYRAGRSFREALSLNAERMVESRAVVLPRDGRRELDHLLRVKMPPQLLEQFVRNLDRSFCHCCRITQHQLLQFRKSRTCLEVNLQKLLFGDSLLSAHGRTDINSKRAPYLRRDFDASK